MGFLDRIQDSISSATEQTRLKAQETQLNRERRQRLEALGERVYGLYMSGSLAHEELTGLCREVADLDGRIRALEEQAAAEPPGAPAAPPGTVPESATSPGPVCAGCGTPVPFGAKFCPGCGMEAGVGRPPAGEAGGGPPAGAAPAAPPPPPPPPPP